MLPAQSPESRTVARLQCVIHLAVLSLRLHDLFRQTDLDPDIRLHLVSQQIDRRGADGQRKEAARETPSLRLAIYRSGSGSKLRSVPCAISKTAARSFAVLVHVIEERCSRLWIGSTSNRLRPSTTLDRAAFPLRLFHLRLRVPGVASRGVRQGSTFTKWLVDVLQRGRKQTER